MNWYMYTELRIVRVIPYTVRTVKSWSKVWLLMVESI